MIRHAVGLVACVTLLASSAAAQYVNRALYLGREDDPFRRDYGQDEEYFVNRWSYVDLPPWWRGASLDPFGNRLFLAGGSVTSSALTLENVGNVGVDLGKGFTGRMNYLGSENQTTRFQRIAFGFDAALSESSSLLIQLEGTTDKSRADLSLGAELFRSESSAHRMMFTLVDWSYRKSTTFGYETAPYGLMFVGFFGDPEGVEFVYDLGLQLPFEESSQLDDERFEMLRAIGFFGARVRVGESDRLVFDLDGELTSKDLRYSDPGAAAREDADIGKGRLRAEWWHSGEKGREYAFGASYLALDEDYVRPNDHDESLLIDRWELMLSARARFPLGKSWSLEPYAMGGHVDLAENRVNVQPGDESFNGFQGKWGVPFRFDFSEHAFFRFDFSFQLDEPKFGGGGVQLLATF